MLTGSEKPAKELQIHLNMFKYYASSPMTVQISKKLLRIRSMAFLLREQKNYHNDIVMNYNPVSSRWGSIALQYKSFFFFRNRPFNMENPVHLCPQLL